MTERSNKKKYPLCAAALALAVLLAGCAPAEGTAAATAQPTAKPTEAPTPTPEPEMNPLTGEQGDYTNQRPVAVSIRTGDGSTPQWGIAAADVLIEGVTEGKTAGLTAVFASVDSVEKAGPVAPGRDLPLQLVLPLNAVPVHINKSVYASNLLNVLQYQDLDGYHAGTAGFAFDEDRANSGYREENCWYTTKDLINTGLATYNTDTAGANMPLFHFVQRKDPEQQNAKSLYITFSNKDTEELVYSPEVGLYLKNNADGSPMMDAGNNEQAAFTNVFVLYASSGVKDDGVTRQYDLTGGTGIYLTKGGWETIQWTKGDATAPLQLTDASGKTLDVNPGKSFLAIWGGYYGQALRLLDRDGNEQALPEKPALLDSAVPDEAAEAAEQAQQHAQALADAQDKLNQAQTALNEALQAQQDAAGTADSADDDAASQRVAEAQAAYDAAAAEFAARGGTRREHRARRRQRRGTPERTGFSQRGKRRLTHNRKPKNKMPSLPKQGRHLVDIGGVDGITLPHRPGSHRAQCQKLRQYGRASTFRRPGAGCSHSRGRSSIPPACAAAERGWPSCS